MAALAAGAVARADSGSKVSYLSAINDEIGMTRAETFAFAKQYGIQFLELRAAQFPGKRRYCEALDAAEIRELSKQLADNGLKVSVLDSSLLKCAYPGTVAVSREEFYTRYFAELGLSDEDLFRKRMEMLKRTIEAAHGLGAQNIRVFAFWRIADPSSILARVAEVLNEMGEVAAKEKCRLLLENETSTNVATSSESAEFLRLAPAMGLNWDPQNAIAYEPAPFPDGYAKLPKKRIGNVHVKAEGLFGPKHPLDWGAIMHAMVGDGFTGKFSLETHRGHNEENVRVSRQAIEKMIGLVNAA